MAAYFDQLDRCSFNGIAFPVEEVSIIGRARRHVHEYPHAPGGATEKLGRGVYVVKIRTQFDEQWNDRYPGLYPDGLEALYRFFETETTGGLDLPTLGKIDAWCINWTKTMHYAIRSGERVEFEFEEDQSQLFLIDALLAAAATTLELDNNAVLAAIPDVVTPAPSIFDTLTLVVNDLVSLKDQNNLAWSLIQAKAEQVVTLFQQASDTVAELGTPTGAVCTLLEALKETASAAQALAEDVAQKQAPIKRYVTPRRGTIVDAAVAIYGASDRALELLQLNDVIDAFDIPANVTLSYYDSAA